MGLPALMQTGGHNAAAFRTTRWSMVGRAAAPAHPQGPAALAEMCTDYWPPLYAFARRLGRSPPDAEDLTQSFFAALVEKNKNYAFLQEGVRRTPKFEGLRKWTVDLFGSSQGVTVTLRRRNSGLEAGTRAVTVPPALKVMEAAGTSVHVLRVEDCWQVTEAYAVLA